MALPLALAIGAVPAICTTAVLAAEPEESDESEAEADESPAPKIYKWIDENGIAHYTTEFKRIPAELRDRVGKLGPPDAALTRTPVDADAPPGPVPSVPKLDRGEAWAVRNRAFERPQGAWDAGDPYADTFGATSVPEELEENAAFLSEAEQEERIQQLEDLDERIASLQTDIAANEEALKVLVTIPVPEGGGPLAMADDPAFREAAGRLPKLLAELRALEDERAQLEAP
jgi:hypothetical protein